MEEESLQGTQGPAADELIAPDDEAPGGPAAEVDVGHVVADQLDPARVGHAEPAVLGHPEVGDGQGIVAHEPGRRGVERDRVGGGEDQVSLSGEHRPRPRPVADDRPVHHGEHAGVELLLHGEEVDQHLVDELVGVVADLLQEPAEGVLDRARGDGVPVRVVQDDPVADERVRALDREVVQERHLGRLLPDLVDPVPGQILARQEPEVRDLLRESPGRVAAGEEVDEIPRHRPCGLRMAVLDAVDRPGPAGRGVGQAEALTNRPEERRRHGDRVPVARPPPGPAPSDQRAKVSLFVRAAERDPLGQGDDVVSVDRDLRVLLRRTHPPVRGPVADGADEGQNAEPRQEHLDLARQTAALRDRVEPVRPDRAVPVEVTLEEGRDLRVGAPEEEVGHRLRARAGRHRKAERLEERPEVQRVEVQLPDAGPRDHAEQGLAQGEVVRADLRVGVRH